MLSQEMLLKVKIKPKGEASRQVVAMSANQYSGVSTHLNQFLPLNSPSSSTVQKWFDQASWSVGQVESFASI